MSKTYRINEDGNLVTERDFNNNRRTKLQEAGERYNTQGYEANEVPDHLLPAHLRKSLSLRSCALAGWIS